MNVSSLLRPSPVSDARMGRVSNGARLRVKGCLRDDVGGTSSVPQIADDLLQCPSWQSRARCRRNRTHYNRWLVEPGSNSTTTAITQRETASRRRPTRRPTLVGCARYRVQIQEEFPMPP